MLLFDTWGTEHTQTRKEVKSERISATCMVLNCFSVYLRTMFNDEKRNVEDCLLLSQAVT